MKLAMTALGVMLTAWVTGAPTEVLPEPLFPDRGSWGVNIHYPGNDRILEECGVQWVRIGERWKNSETSEKGVYDFTEARRLINFYRDRNINMIFLLNAEDRNPLYEGEYDNQDVIIDAISDWSAALVAEFKDVPGVIWELGNEPEVFPMGGYWNVPETYTKLARASAAKIKAVAPEAKIGAFSVAWFDPDFIERSFKAGLLADGNIQILTFHGYHRATMAPESRLEEDLKWMRKKAAEYAPDGMRIDWIDSERGYGIIDKGEVKDTGSWRNYTRSEEEQAAYLARHYLEEIYLGLEVSIWYKDFHGEKSYSLYYDGTDSALRPMGRVFRNLAHLLPENPRKLANREFNVDLTIPQPTSIQPFVRSFRRVADGANWLVIAAWYPVEAFDGQILQSREMKGNECIERWRELTPEDQVTLKVGIQTDLPLAQIASVRKLDLLAEQPMSFTEVDVAENDGNFELQADLGVTPQVWVIELAD